MLVFQERGKPEYPEKNLQQTQPTYGVDAGIWTRATLVGGERSHHCAIPCSPKDDLRWSRSRSFFNNKWRHHRVTSDRQRFFWNLLANLIIWFGKNDGIWVLPIKEFNNNVVIIKLHYVNVSTKLYPDAENDKAPEWRSKCKFSHVIMFNKSRSGLIEKRSCNFKLKRSRKLRHGCFSISLKKSRGGLYFED